MSRDATREEVQDKAREAGAEGGRPVRGSMAAFVGSLAAGRRVRMERGQKRQQNHVAVNMVAAKPSESEKKSLWDHTYVTDVPQSLVDKLSEAGDNSMRSRFEAMIRGVQDQLCKEIEELDGEGTFKEDAWVRENGGGGISRVLQNGKVGL